MLDTEAINHFKAGREALLRKRKEIDHAIEEVDRILKVILGPDTAPRTADPPGGLLAGLVMPGKTFRQAVLEIITEHGGEIRVAELLPAVADRGLNVSDASARSMLAKLVQNKALMNPARGVYTLPQGGAL